MSRKQHEWRMSEEEMQKRMIIRALKRDIPNGGHAWSAYIKSLACKIENGDITLTLIKKEP